MTNKQRIEELEKRVRELEARPYWPVIVLQPYVPAPPPVYPSWPAWPHSPLGPFYVTTTTTALVNQ